MHFTIHRYIEGASYADQINLLEDDSFTEAAVGDMLTTLRQHHSIQPIVLACLHSLVKDLPGSIFGKQVSVGWGLVY